MKIYGPYVRSDGRKHVVHYNPETKKRTTQSYPRYLMEQYLGRQLEEHETVDHINEDFTDDRLENLQLLSRAENIHKNHEATGHKTKYLDFICPVCNKEFKREERNYNHNQLNNKKAGPFCSRSCAGIYSTS